MNICIFGDSITWGAFDLSKGGWANRLRNYFEKEGKDINVYNLGVAGNLTSDLLKRIGNEAKVRKPDLVVFAIGINDAQYLISKNKYQITESEFEKNINMLIKIARKFTSKILFVGITPVDEGKTKPILLISDISYTNSRIKKLDRIIKKVCRENNIQFIPVNDLLKNKDLIDGLHPNIEGHKKLYEKIKPEIDSFINN